jgi:hypothetical protein
MEIRSSPFAVCAYMRRGMSRIERIETMALQSMTALKSMSIEKLMNLKSDVEAMLAQKVSEQRHSLRQELSKCPSRILWNQ